jgi:flavin reductase (DIM6/NTAB) family NADH-FMN oxidoreductase RutF
VVFITSAHGGQKDIMTATAMFVSEKEPLLQVSVAKNHLTEKLILASGRFTVIIAGSGQQTLAMQVGSVKGADADKFASASIPLEKTAPAAALVPEGAAAWMACRVESSQEISGYRLFIGRVIDQARFEVAPLLWCDNAFFTLAKI